MLFRRLFNGCRFGAIVAILVVCGALTLAQDDPSGYVTDHLNVRSGPGITFSAVDLLPAGTKIYLEARNSIGNWVRIHTAADEAVRGWVGTAYLKLDDSITLSDVPIDLTVLDADPAAAPSEDMAALYTVPIIPAISQRVRDIYGEGQKHGAGNVIAKVGDCNSQSIAFLAPLDTGAYDLGHYDYLQPTIDFFSGSYDHDSVAAEIGYTALAVLDPLWSDPARCEAGETPLACEYRDIHPSVAIIMFGTNDIYNLSSQQYEQALRQIIEQTLDDDIVPILSTFTSDPARTDRWHMVIKFNRTIVDLAAEYDIPVMNFWLAARALPGYGLAADNAHLTQSGGTLSFNGEETWAGFTLRNLVTLQTLAALRQAITS